MAIGVAGLRPVLDLRGRLDRNGYELHATVVAVADEIAAAAELVMGKTNGIPAAIVRGLDLAGEGAARELVMPPERDLFPLICCPFRRVCGLFTPTAPLARA